MALPSDIDPPELRKRLQQPGIAAGKGGAELIVVPGYVGACTGWEMGTATIRWKVDPAQVSKVQIEVSSSSEKKRTPFAGGVLVGEAVAQDWVREGLTFTLVDLSKGRDLASYTVEALPCAQM